MSTHIYTASVWIPSTFPASGFISTRIEAEYAHSWPAGRARRPLILLYMVVVVSHVTSVPSELSKARYGHLLYRHALSLQTIAQLLFSSGVRHLSYKLLHTYYTLPLYIAFALWLNGRSVCKLIIIIIIFIHRSHGRWIQNHKKCTKKTYTHNSPAVPTYCINVAKLLCRKISIYLMPL